MTNMSHSTLINLLLSDLSCHLSLMKVMMMMGRQMDC